MTYCRPAFIKAHRLGYSEQDWRYFEESFGTPLDRLTNIYALFLLKIWEDFHSMDRCGHCAGGICKCQFR